MLKLLCAILLCLCCGLACCDVEIDLQSYNPQNAGKNQNLFTQYYNLYSTTQISVKNINEHVGFFIIQIHSFMETVTLTYNSKANNISSIVSGSNIGLVYGYADNTANFTLSKENRMYSTEVLIAVTVYSEADPVPGGCNLSFQTELAPYQIVFNRDDVITVDSQPPSAYGVACDANNNKIDMEMYHLFINAFEHNISYYFEAVSKMLTVEDIRKHGRKVRYFQYRRLFSDYENFAQIFAIVATYNNKSAAYVPAASYGCGRLKMQNNADSCTLLAEDTWVYFLTFTIPLFIFGVFTNLSGHKYFKTTLFLMGFIFGVFFTFIMITFSNSYTFEEKLAAASGMGTVYGIGWLFIWWSFGVPVISVMLSYFLAGLLVASSLFYTGLSDYYVFSNNTVFWITFSCVVLGTMSILMAFTHIGHIISCNLLGSYAFITAISIFAGLNLQYIILNTLRRISVVDFNKALIDPPFGAYDWCLFVCWMLFLALGYFIQYVEQIGKPPFPPNRNVLQVLPLSETTPLL